MFSILVEAKGVQRRVTFRKSQINVGRGEGNDLDLRSGKVSRHHVRLLYEQDQFVIVDLESANGTYVNGFRVSQPTRVRDDDQILVGDFVLRVVSPSKDDAPSTAGAADPAAGRAAPGQTRVAGAEPDHRRLAPVGTHQPGVTTRPPAEAPEPAPSGEAQELSEDWLDWLEDERNAEAQGRAGTDDAEPAEAEERQTALGPARSVLSLLSDDSAAFATDRTKGAATAPPPETPAQAAQRATLTVLVERVTAVADPAALDPAAVVSPAVLQSVERVVGEQVQAMNDLREGIDRAQLARHALRELVGLGPLEALLHDSAVREVYVARPDCVLAFTDDGAVTRSEVSFTGEAAVARVVARLGQRSGEPVHPGERVIHRRVGRGAWMMAISPPLASGWAVRIRKVWRFESTLEELLQARVLSRTVRAFLALCARARVNLLVAGPDRDAVCTLLAAVASAAPAGERLAVVQPPFHDIAVARASVVSLSDDSAQGVEAAARLGADRLLVASLHGAVSVATIDAAAEGTAGILAAMCAPTLETAMARLGGQINLARPGSTVTAARHAIAHSFDVAVELTRTAAGALKVRRVAELDPHEPRGVRSESLFLRKATASNEDAYVAGPVSDALADRFRQPAARPRTARVG